MHWHNSFIMIAVMATSSDIIIAQKSQLVSYLRKLHQRIVCFKSAAIEQLCIKGSFASTLSNYRTPYLLFSKHRLIGQQRARAFFNRLLRSSPFIFTAVTFFKAALADIIIFSCTLRVTNSLFACITCRVSFLAANRALYSMLNFDSEFSVLALACICLEFSVAN